MYGVYFSLSFGKRSNHLHFVSKYTMTCLFLLIYCLDQYFFWKETDECHLSALAPGPFFLDGLLDQNRCFALAPFTLLLLF